MKTVERMRREFEEWACIEPIPFLDLERSQCDQESYFWADTQAAWLAWREQERRIAALIGAVRGELDRSDGDSDIGLDGLVMPVASK